MMRKLVSRRFCMRSCALRFRRNRPWPCDDPWVGSRKSFIFPARKASFACIALRPEEICAKRCRRCLNGSPPARTSASHSSRSSGRVCRWSRTSIDDGVRWNTYSSATTFASSGTTCTDVAPVPMIPTRFPRRSTL